MTCIVGLVDKGKVYIGGDSAGVDLSFSLSVRADRKVFTNGGLLFGIAGSFRMGNLLQHKLVVPQFNEVDDPHRWMVTEFIDAVRHCFLVGGFMQKEDNVEAAEGDFLCGFAGRLFAVYGDLQVGETLDEYAALGCGFQIAEGSMFSTKGKGAHSRVQTALEAAEQHSGGVRGPFHIESV